MNMKARTLSRSGMRQHDGTASVSAECVTGEGSYG
jgi:hypothetical protein